MAWNKLRHCPLCRVDWTNYLGLLSYELQELALCLVKTILDRPPKDHRYYDKAVTLLEKEGKEAFSDLVEEITQKFDIFTH